MRPAIPRPTTRDTTLSTPRSSRLAPVSARRSARLLPEPSAIPPMTPQPRQSLTRWGAISRSSFSVERAAFAADAPPISSAPCVMMGSLEPSGDATQRPATVAPPTVGRLAEALDSSNFDCRRAPRTCSGSRAQTLALRHRLRPRMKSRVRRRPRTTAICFAVFIYFAPIFGF